MIPISRWQVRKPTNGNHNSHHLGKGIIVTFLSSAFVMGFGLFGLGLFLYEKRFNALLFALLLQLAVLVAFYILCRFKTPFVVSLIPFAGYGISTIIKKIQFNFQKGIIYLVIPLILSGLFLYMPPNPSIKYRYGDLTSFWNEHYLKEIRKLDPTDKKTMALFFEEMISHQPKALHQRADPNLNSYDEEVVKFYANAYADLADLYRDQGLVNQQSQALKESERLERLIERKFRD